MIKIIEMLVLILALAACSGPSPSPGLVACADPAHNGLECLIEPATRGFCDKGLCAVVPCLTIDDCADGWQSACRSHDCIKSPGESAGYCKTTFGSEGQECSIDPMSTGTCADGLCVP